MSNVTEFMLTAAAARELDCTPDGVRYLDRTGRLPALRVSGGVRLFRRDDVERLRLDRQEKRQAAAPAREAEAQ